MYGKRGCNSSRVSSSRPLRPRLGDCFRERMAMPIVGAHQSITAHEIACKAAFEVMAVNLLTRSLRSIPIWINCPSLQRSMELYPSSRLRPGEHAIHFHQNAKCDAPDFKPAGGHFNPDAKKHGLENPEGHHAGDNPNFTAGANGKAHFKAENKDVTL